MEVHGSEDEAVHAKRELCTNMLAVVPKTAESNLKPDYLQTLSVDEKITYMEEHSEQIGTPCKWLVRDEVTTEATCKVYDHRGRDCRNYSEDHTGRGDEWCPVGLAYWSLRKESSLPIPKWIEVVLAEIHNH
jgi:hypothetical protein